MKCFKYYNPKQVVMGKTMEEWLRFSVCFWHTFRGTGEHWEVFRGGRREEGEGGRSFSDIFMVVNIWSKNW